MTLTLSKGGSIKLKICMQSHMKKNIVSHLCICERLRILRIPQTYTEKKPEMTLTLSKGRSIKLKTYVQSHMKKNIGSHLCICEKQRILRIPQTYTEKKPEMNAHIIKRQVNQAENMYAKSYEKKYRLSPLHL
jgi:hypothetical protein